MPLAQEALKTLSAKYQLHAEGPDSRRDFPEARRLRRPHARPARHDWRARRVLRPRRLARLAACARPPGSFSWQATLWHEMTHVITLQMSNQRVPRWLTEGISDIRGDAGPSRVGTRHGNPVCDGARTRQDPEARGSELRIHATRHDRARVLRSVAARRSHRRRPTASAKLQALVRSYGEGLEGDAAIEEGASASTLPELQGSFDKALDARFGAHARGAARHPGRPGAGCRWARRSTGPRRRCVRRRGASGQLRGAAGATGRRSPPRAIAPRSSRSRRPRRWCRSPPARTARTRSWRELAEQLGDTARAMAEYRALLAQDHTTVEAGAAARRARGESIGDAARCMLAYDRDRGDRSVRSAAHTRARAARAQERRSRTRPCASSRRRWRIGPADKAVGALRSRRERTCSPTVRPRPSAKRSPRSRSRRASIARRSCCCARSKAAGAAGGRQ